MIHSIYIMYVEVLQTIVHFLNFKSYYTKSES